MRYFALVDCNNFYASCERVFQPRYANTPIVVLSNNDGCVIARSNEAKEIGIPMGEPVFKVRPLIRKNNIKVFSSNYSLYGDMSHRVMEVLSNHCADIEIYSIDEAFLELRFANQSISSLTDWAKTLREKVFNWVGIPVSIGIAPTKTLAKLANHIAKRRNGIYYLSPTDKILSDIDISKVWGVGKAYVRRLGDISSVLELSQVSEAWMRQEFGVVGLRLLKEVKGYACYDLEPPQTERKHTMVSRSFATDVTSLEELCERIAINATRLGEKLRQYNQHTSVLTIYLWTNKYKQKENRKSFAQTIELPLATNNTNTIIRWAIAILKRIYRKNIAYKKSGILASHLTPKHQLQTSLFVPHESEQQFNQVTEVMDQLNKKMGRNTIHFAATGAKPSFRMRQDYKSPSYTTRWGDLLCVR